MNKIYANDIVLKESFHPGEFIKDELEARGMKQQELADKMEVAKNVLSEIIHAKRNLTPLLALKLEAALGINAEFWLRLQGSYDITLLRKQQKTAKLSAPKKPKSTTALNSNKIISIVKKKTPAIKVKKK